MAYAVPLPGVLLAGNPTAQALLSGSDAHPSLMGEVLLYPFQSGSLLLARVTGLPPRGFFGFHIHSLGNCQTGGDIPFHCAGDHYNPDGGQHPDHAGDLPPLLSAGGQAYQFFYTDRFQPHQVVGRSVVIHALPDDFHSQPAGNSGPRIACGTIAAL